ncbi:hypothetical protein [Streptomyces sp. NPDC094468]|uniref:hypothetical protein n=1 Tax=Streptomyces sp. NPDC094468 TaxID=3366066 RepID=UPI0037F261D3
MLKKTRASRVAAVAMLAAVVLSGCNDTKTVKKDQSSNGPGGYQCEDVKGGCGTKSDIHLPPKVSCAAAMLPAIPEFKQQDATSDPITHMEEGDQYRISAAGYSRTGYFLPVSSQGCSYSVELTATLSRGLDTSEGLGWGYGLGACNSWTGEGPQGFSLQYAFINDGGTINPNNSLNDYPDVNDLHASAGTINSNGDTHVWRITFKGRNVTINEDAGPVGTFNALRDAKSPYEYARSLPDDCNNKGVFLRVFNADVTFSNIKVEMLAT